MSAAAAAAAAAGGAEDGLDLASLVGPNMAKVSPAAVAGVNPELAARYQAELERRRREGASASAAADAAAGDGIVSVPLRIGSRVDERLEGGCKWTVFVEPQGPDADLVVSTTFTLHETFTPRRVEVRAPGPFELTRSGWGTFTIRVRVKDASGAAHKFEHELSFDDEPAVRTEEIKCARVSAAAAAAAAADTATRPPAGADVPRARMEGVDEVGMHGHNGVGKGWGAPLLATACDAEARPGYNSMKSDEFLDDPVTLRAKVAELARLLRTAKHPIAYTGAGLSTGAGINDYASSANKASIATGAGAGARKKVSGLDAEPTFAHFTLAALERAGFLAHLLNQNHDCLGEKAGFPKEKCNEIHGDWFDPSNPVVPMSGSLRGDLFQWMLDEEQASDLTLAMGTSLCGMNSDRMVKSPAKRFLRQGKGLGSVIIGLQRTALDELASLHIYAKIDDVMLLLALEMDLPVLLRGYEPDVPAHAVGKVPHTFRVPYASNGKRRSDWDPNTTDGDSYTRFTTWDLRVGAKVKLCAGPGKGFEGEITRVPGSKRDDAYSVRLPCTREGDLLGKGFGVYALGVWFVEAAAKGKLAQLPFVNFEE